MSPLEMCQWLDSTRFATSFRQSLDVYPAVEGMHVLGLAFSVGTVVWFDLRLAGAAMRRYPVSEVFGSVKPWMLAGFANMIVTGVMLFVSHAEQACRSPYFQAKVVMLLLAVVNIAVFHGTIDRRRVEWDRAPLPPLQARVAGIASLILWIGIIVAGRLMAYHLM
jgi:hypothetical protein